MTKSKVALCMPVKNGEPWLPKNLEIIESFGKEINRVIISYGHSVDDTLNILIKWIKQSKHRVELIREPKPKNTVNSSAEIAFLYHDFQQLVKTGDDTHALLWDSDIVDAPKNLVKKLLKHDKPIIAPYVYIKYHEPGKRFYDTMVYRYKGYRYHAFDPPMHGHKLAQIDSVGCVFLVKREPFTEHPYRDPYPHLLFCNDCRESGYGVWVDPNIEIYHVDLERIGGGNNPIETNPNSRFYNPTYKPPPLITDSGEIVENNDFALEFIQKYVM